jgi:glycosyltransferase involved in cell wall biosynthesis
MGFGAMLASTKPPAMIANNGKISIVIPCYNHGEMLREALESIEKVRNSNLLEVIIVNDGSTDAETCKLFQELADSKYKIIHQPNRGLGAARNAGVQIAQGEFILPLDSDNFIRKAYLTDGVKLLQENPDVGIVYGDAEYFGGKTGRWQVEDFDLLQMTYGNYIDACALYRKCVWESVHGYDEKMPYMGWEDWDFWLRVALHGWQFRHLVEVSFDYRVSKNSMLQRETDHHQDELRSYIFNKRENHILHLIKNRETLIKNREIELNRLKGIEKSKDYRVGQFILYPFRKAKKLLT